MSIIIDVQEACDEPNLPDDNSLHQWVNLAFEQHQQAVAQPPNHEPFEMTIRFVDEVEGRQLNERWRKRVGPTNVLSFPFENPPGCIVPLLGDIVLCVPVVVGEAKQYQTPLRAHWAHLVIHGTLHLLGYDHIDDSQAQLMENLEIKCLTSLGYPNPYETNPSTDDC